MPRRHRTGWFDDENYENFPSPRAWIGAGLCIAGIVLFVVGKLLGW